MHIEVNTIDIEDNNIGILKRQSLSINGNSYSFTYVYYFSKFQ